MGKRRKRNLKSTPQGFRAKSKRDSIPKDQSQSQITAEQVKQQLNLGIKHWQSGQFPEAEASLQQLLKWQPNNHHALNFLGIICAQIGQTSRAIQLFAQAIKLNPQDFNLHSNLGNTLKEQGKLAEAIASYQIALQLKPDYYPAHNNLGFVLEEQGKLEEAIASYQRALQLKPDFHEAHNNLGNALKKQGKLEEARQSYQTALRLQPNYYKAYNNLGLVLQEQGKLEEARQSYQKALQLKPDYGSAKMNICMSQLPIIYSTTEELEYARSNYQEHLQNLANYYARASQAEQAKAADGIGSSQPFYLAYQGLNDRDLQKTYGDMICQLMSSRYPQWTQPLPPPVLEPNEKIRVGFISGLFRNHSVGKIPLRGWIENIDKKQFELFGYHTSSIKDEFTARAKKSFVKFIQGSLSLEKWCETIAQDKLHIVIFPELGIDPMAIKLGCLRLAPIQMTSWGHPETSGLPTIDYYLSSDLMEPDNGQEHYTEKLFQLPNLSIYYTPLSVQPQRLERKKIGIEDNEIVFLCCQSLFKYLPQHDDVFPLIARELAVSKFVFFESKHGEEITEIFRQRLSDAFKEFGLNYQDYCVFLPRQDFQTFTGTMMLADIFLDGIGFSGANTALEAITHNLPIVTLSGDLMRGRLATGILKMMEVEETIASNKDDYVQIAIRLGKDSPYREYICQKVAKNKHKLYGDLKPIRVLEDFWLKLVQGNENLSIENTERINQNLLPRKSSSKDFTKSEKDKTQSQITSEQVNQQLNLGIQHWQSGQFPEAQACLQQVLKWQPNNHDAWNFLGIICTQTGQTSRAIQIFNQAIELNPQDFNLYSNLGNALQEQGKLEQAIESYQTALQLKPDYSPAHNNLGNALQEQGKLEEAIEFYQTALQLQPSFYKAHNNLGNALQEQGKLEEAIEFYQTALQLQPDFYKAHNNLGNALKKQGKLEKAIESYLTALQLQPNYHKACNNLGLVLQEQGKLEEAISFYERALQINPEDLTALSQYVFSRRMICHWDGLRSFEQSLISATKSQQWVTNAPFPMLSVTDNPSVQLSAAQSFCNEITDKSLSLLWKGERYNHDKIRLAYLSADYHQHATAYLMAELFELHDQSQFELFAISFGQEDNSPMRQRLVKAFDHFVDVRQMSDLEVAQQIRNLEIDIAIDLKGYTKDSHPQILAHRPAPIQVNYLGYPGTMGADFIDYILVDRFIVPPDQQPYFTEKLVHLPECYQVNDSKRVVADYTPSRQECGLPEQGFVFCSFNNSYKITPKFFDIWMRLLKAVPGSVLWLLETNQSVKNNLRKEAKARGVNPARLIFAPKQQLPEHLARQRLADLFLDNLPCNAHTTTSDALWVGLPVLTCAGRSFASRVAGSLLHTIGLPELVTYNLEDYEAMALKLATQPNLLHQIKEKLKQNRLSSPLFDCDRFRQHIEVAYKQMWSIWQRGDRPKAFAITLNRDASTQFNLLTINETETPKPTINKKFIIILGSWGSGTTALARVLSALNVNFCPPFFQTNDIRTQNSFESTRFRAVIEKSLKENDPNLFQRETPNLLKDLDAFRKEIIDSEKESDIIGLKMPLASLCVKELNQIFNPYFLVVHRPLDQIEASRQRRGWPALYGSEGAEYMYQRLFFSLIDEHVSFLNIAYEQILNNTESEIDRIASFCNIKIDSHLIEEASQEVRKNSKTKFG